MEQSLIYSIIYILFSYDIFFILRGILNFISNSTSAAAIASSLLRFSSLAFLRYSYGVPVIRLQLLNCNQIPLPIIRNLIHPELSITFGRDVLRTPLMPMPEATIHKNHRPVLLQHQVRTSGKHLAVKTVSVAHMPQLTTHSDFRSRVF